MATLITIAGPQSSGKSSALKIIKQKYPNINLFEEINPYLVTNKNHLGAAFVDKNLQIKIIKAEIKRTKNSKYI